MRYDYNNMLAIIHTQLIFICVNFINLSMNHAHTNILILYPSWPHYLSFSYTTPKLYRYIGNFFFFFNLVLV